MQTNKYMSEKIVFPHVMKTGGTAIIVWIQRHFYFDEILWEASVWPELIQLHPKAFEHKKFVRGHFGSGILNVFGAHNGFTSITLLREPVERAISHYWHLKYAPDSESSLAFVKEASFTLEDFLEHPATHHIVSNYQTANFSAIIGATQEVADEPHVSPELSPLNIERAKSFIDRCEVVGVTEDLNAFIKASSDRFGFFPDYALQRYRSYRQHTTFSDEVINKIRSLNEADCDLYDYAKKRSHTPRKYYSLGVQKNLMLSVRTAS